MLRQRIFVLHVRLEHARATENADLSIIEEFNKKRLGGNYSGEKAEIRDEDIKTAVANDGTLRGGLDPSRAITGLHCQPRSHDAVAQHEDARCDEDNDDRWSRGIRKINVGI